MGANAIPLGMPGAMSGHPVPAVNTLATATRFLVLLGAVTLEELEDESEYNDIVQDMQVRVAAAAWACCSAVVQFCRPVACWHMRPGIHIRLQLRRGYHGCQQPGTLHSM